MATLQTIKNVHMHPDITMHCMVEKLQFCRFVQNLFFGGENFYQYYIWVILKSRERSVCLQVHIRVAGTPVPTRIYHTPGHTQFNLYTTLHVYWKLTAVARMWQVDVWSPASGRALIIHPMLTHLLST